MSLAPLPPTAILTLEEAAAYLGVSERQMRRLPIPKAKLSPRVVRYRGEDILAYVQRITFVRPAA